MKPDYTLRYVQCLDPCSCGMKAVMHKHDKYTAGCGYCQVQVTAESAVEAMTGWNQLMRKAKEQQ